MMPDLFYGGSAQAIMRKFYRRHLRELEDELQDKRIRRASHEG
jgi:hypothetical protein